MAVEARTERTSGTPRPAGPDTERRPMLELVPGPDALLNPRAADALVLASRPLSGDEDPEPKRVVAVVLADGSLRELNADGEGRPEREWDGGSVSGPDWILWWERRSFD